MQATPATTSDTADLPTVTRWVPPYFTRFDQQQCPWCGSFPCDQSATTCRLCGARQCMGNGGGNGQCSICYRGLLWGWVGSDTTCTYARCNEPAGCESCETGSASGAFQCVACYERLRPQREPEPQTADTARLIGATTVDVQPATSDAIVSTSAGCSLRDIPTTGPVVNGEQFAPGYTPEAAAYEQQTREAPAALPLAQADEALRLVRDAYAMRLTAEDARQVPTQESTPF